VGFGCGLVLMRAQDPAYVLVRLPLLATGAARNKVPRAGQSKPSPAYGPVATIRSGGPRGCGCRRQSAAAASTCPATTTSFTTCVR